MVSPNVFFIVLVDTAVVIFEDISPESVVAVGDVGIDTFELMMLVLEMVVLSVVVVIVSLLTFCYGDT